MALALPSDLLAAEVPWWTAGLVAACCWTVQRLLRRAVRTPESQERIERLVEASEKVCPITSLLVNPQSVTGSVVVTPSTDAALVGAGVNGRAG